MELRNHLHSHEGKENSSETKEKVFNILIHIYENVLFQKTEKNLKLR